MMTKPKIAKKKFRVNPVNIERNMLIVLLVAFVISGSLLLVRSETVNKKVEINEKPNIVEPEKQ